MVGWITAPVDLSSVIATGNVFAPLQDPSYFTQQMRVAEDRLGLEWPNQVDFSADGLRFRAFPDEEKAEFAGLEASATQTLEHRYGIDSPTIAVEGMTIVGR